MSDHDRFGDDLAAYALGALPPEEAAELERHLEQCEACRAELRWLSPAVDVLPAAVVQRTPPDRLRENLMEVVRAEAAAERPAPARPTRAREPWWRGLGALAMRPAAGIAAVILVIAGIGAGYLLRGSDSNQPTLVQAEALTGAPVSATLERDGDTSTLHVHEMPPIGPDKVYEVWIQRGGNVEPVSTFVLSADGTAEAAVPGSLAGGEAVLVTREPRGGSAQPTTAPLLSVPL
jgi:anti-sigma-K factor RskA